MKSITIILILLSFILFSANAYEIPPECQKAVPRECASCTIESGKKEMKGQFENLTGPMKSVADYAFLEEEVAKINKVNIALKKSLVPLFRSLRDGPREPEYQRSQEEINLIRLDFDRLTVLSKEAIILQKKFDICTTRCSATRRLEITDEIALVQKMKTALFIKQPILANKKFEERMSNLSNPILESDALFNKSVFEDDLKEALSDNLGKIMNRETEYAMFEMDGKKPYRSKGNEVYVKDYLGKVTSRFPNIMEDVVKSSLYEGSFKNSNTHDSACFYAEEFKSYSTKKEYKELALDAGLFILPLFAGPFGAEVVMAERLVGWGLKSTDAIRSVKATSMLFQAGIIAKDYEQLKTLSEECKKNEVQFLAKSNEYELREFRDCQKSLGEKIFLAELGLVVAGTSNISVNALKFLSRAAPVIKTPQVIAQEVNSANEISIYIYKNGLNELKKGQVGLEFGTKDSGVFSIMDLNAVAKSTNTSVQKIPEDYWRYVGNIYSERLNLTKNEIESFIKSSVEMSPRTKLVLNTEKSPLTGNMKINGGVGIVQAHKAEELLPLEKATGIRIDKKPNEKIVEIVRLTVGKDVEAEKMSTALISQATSLIVQDKSVSRVFIFTSKVHARLYKRMGIPADKIKNIDKRDVVIEFTRADLEKMMEKKMLEKASSLIIRELARELLLSSSF